MPIEVKLDDSLNKVNIEMTDQCYSLRTLYEGRRRTPSSSAMQP